jgi:hypothetical protein
MAALAASAEADQRLCRGDNLRTAADIGHKSKRAKQLLDAPEPVERGRLSRAWDTGDRNRTPSVRHRAHMMRLSKMRAPVWFLEIVAASGRASDRGRPPSVG